MDELLVSISCITFNQAPYIRQCLDSFLMQKTNFKFEVLVHDDASTDGTSEIIKEYKERYPHIIKPMFQSDNQYSKGVRGISRFNFNRAKGKYIAMCDGDDYWIDPYKLQKQVDFMESHPKCGLLHTNYIYYRPSANLFRDIEMDADQGSIFELLLRGNQIATLTVLMRNSFIQEFLKQDELVQSPLFIDYFLWLFIAERSEINFIADSTAVYRSLHESVSNSWDERKMREFEALVINIKIFFAKRNNKLYLIEDQILKHNQDMLLFAFYTGNAELIKKSYNYLFIKNKVLFKDWLMYKTYTNSILVLFTKCYIKTIELTKSLLQKTS